MRFPHIFTLIIILIFCSGFNFTISYKSNVNQIEKQFQLALNNVENIVYTKVPRGLIISIDERYFFDCNEVLIKESSLSILNNISETLKKLPNFCVVENHTEAKSNVENWELSVQRASNIAEYLVKYGNLQSQRIFPLGFGEIMPFYKDVPNHNNMNNRIDFVIIEYEVMR